MTRPRARTPRIIRADGWTLPRQRLFLKMLAVTGSVDRACAEAGMSVSAAYRLRLHPEGQAFRNAWAHALAVSATSLRERAFERAINGSLEPVIANGEIVGQRRVYNDRLLMFLLARYDHRPVREPQDTLVDGMAFLVAADVPDAELEPAPDGETATKIAAEFASGSRSGGQDIDKPQFS